jgi:hypothetical protein
MLSEKEIKEVHPEYNENAPLWDYYYRSYVGGDEYKKGAYLRKYLNEDAAPGDQYGQRLANTALQNHVKSIVHIYRSYLFRNGPKRTLANLMNLPDVLNFITDVDLNGTDLNAFMKKLNDGLMVYGSMWVLVDRPAYRTLTRAQELEMGIRAYANAYIPSNVLDWEFKPDVTGKNKLVYLKVVEFSGENYDNLVVWYENRVERYTVEKNQYKRQILTRGSIGQDTGDSIVEYGKIIKSEEYINPLGYIPAFRLLTDDGNSQIADIADTQRSIYNRLSELEQAIRVSGHPTLVKTADTSASAGAGSIITMPEDLPGDKNPYLLQPSGSTINSILQAINMDIDAIDKMAHVSGIRGTIGSAMSGVALQTEMAMLNSRLSDFAEILQEAEYKIWELWLNWQNLTASQDFMIEYGKSFDIRDKQSDLALLEIATKIVNNDMLKMEIQKSIAKILVTDEVKLSAILDNIENPPVRTYENGEPIDPRLPPLYRNAAGEARQCANCEYFNPETLACNAFGGATVRPAWVCAKWEAIELEDNDSSDDDEESDELEYDDSSDDDNASE